MVDASEIKQFCKICDFYKENKPCHVVGEHDQKYYVDRNWCGWAHIEGYSASVTKSTVQVGVVGKVFNRKDEEIFRQVFRNHSKKF